MQTELKLSRQELRILRRAIRSEIDGLSQQVQTGYTREKLQAHHDMLQKLKEAGHCLIDENMAE